MTSNYRQITRRLLALVIFLLGLGSVAMSEEYISPSADTTKPAVVASPDVLPGGSCPIAYSLGISASTTTACPGTTVTFTVTSTNYTLNGGQANYSWYVNGSLASSGSTSFSTTSLTNGSTVYCVVDLDETGCTQVSATSNTIPITVQATPVLTALSGVTTICQSGTAAYSTTSTDATSYTWTVSPSSAGSITSTSSSGSITYSSGFSGTATISVTGKVCSETSSAVSTTVTVTPTVGVPTSPASSSSICPGCTVTYTTSATNATSYNWTLNGSAVSGSGASNAITFPAGMAPEATIGVAANGCNGPSAATMVTLTELLPGAIGPANTVFTSGTTPGILTGDAATGGACSGSYSYLWQSSPDGINFSSITGADSLDHLPANLTATTWFRRQVTCGTTIGYSNIIEAQVSTGTVPDMNFIRQRTILKPGVPDTTTASGLTSIYDVMQSTQYFDGLGRPVQTVAMQQSPLQHDMVSFNVYDPFGREAEKYMPYTATTTDGNFKPTFQGDQDQFNNTQFPGQQFYFSQTNFEPSPLNRVMASDPPGMSWVGAQRGVGQQYLLNQATDSVQIWNISLTAESIPTNGGAYPAGTLYKNVTTDENGNKVVEYTDLTGHVVLKKVQSSPTMGTAHVGWLCTYYVYDNIYNLRFVIPPQAVTLINGSWTISSTVASALCFRYEYDNRRRMSIKKIPGAGEVWMVYDARDRMVMSQDSNQRVLGKWLTTQYDNEDRPDSTGLLTDPNNLSYHENLAAGSTDYPATTGGNYEWLTRTYYDNYGWVTGATSLLNYVADNAGTAQFITTYNTSPLYAQTIVVLYSTRGLVTGHMAKVIGTTNTYLYSNIFYDDHGRQVQTQSINYSGGVDTLTTEYDFSGKPLRVKLDHKNHDNGGDYLMMTKLAYDPASRLKSIYKNINSAATDQLIDSMQYNELGQLRAKYLGNNLDSLIYDYNVRGWVTGINKAYVGATANHYFGMELGYDNQSSVSTTTYAAAQYNGNITGVIWKSMGDGLNRKYDFTYDNANRLTAANFLQNPSGSTWNTAAMDYTVGGLSYDANGNILGMNQKGFRIGNPAGLIDQLTYSYQANSNQLSQVIDGANDTASTLGDFHYKTKGAYDYTYDGNGNLHLDNNKGIDSIGYNYLNLPQYVHMKGKGTIAYTYDASGTKWKKTTTDSLAKHSTTTLYLGSFIYQQNDSITNANGGVDTLQFVQHEEGRARWALHHYMGGATAYGFEYDFYEKDHLGNTRVLLSQEKDTAQYIATMEPANRATENALFYNIDSTSYATTAVPGGYPGGTNGGANDSVAMVSGSQGDHTQGPALILKVMAGDSVSFGVNSYFVGGGTAGSTSSSLSSVLSTLAGGLVSLGASGGEGGTLSALTNSTSGPALAALNSFFPANDPTPSGTPKAYLNWMLLDNQFNYVSGYNQSGALPVGSPNVLNTLATTIKLHHSGYLYIWVSNETQNWMVFFDNLSIEHFNGPMVEESHYYPFGLAMAGISDKALKTPYAENKYRFNKGSELQNKEFSDGSGLEMYATQLRELDPQLGRWWQVDPKSDEAYESVSPYGAFNDDPARYNDPNGDAGEEATACCAVHGAWNIFKKTQELAGATELVGGGPEDPVADVAAVGEEVAGGLWALGKLIFGSDPPAAPTVAAPKAPSGSAPPAKSQTNAQGDKSKAEQRADKLSEKQRPGQDFTKAGKEAVKDVNKEKNAGQMKCDKCGQDVNNAEQHTKGKTPPGNEAHVDHDNPKSNGGSGTPDNGKVLCRDCNIDKGATTPH